jgi:hypothetical protein
MVIQGVHEIISVIQIEIFIDIDFGGMVNKAKFELQLAA